MKLVFKNNLTKAEIEFQVTDKDTSGLFYEFDVQIEEDVDDGEYSYTLYNDDNEIVATGMAQIGDYKPQTSAYTENNGQTFITYAG